MDKPRVRTLIEQNGRMSLSGNSTRNFKGKKDLAQLECIQHRDAVTVP